jgi:hypothetical protein
MHALTQSAIVFLYPPVVLTQTLREFLLSVNFAKNWELIWTKISSKKIYIQYAFVDRWWAYNVLAIGCLADVCFISRSQCKKNALTREENNLST